MSREEYSNKTCKELREIAKELKIVGRWKLNKNQLIEEILVRENEEKLVESKKIDYIENIKVGTLVAFYCPNGKAKSAKVIRKSVKHKILKLETNYGAEYIVPYNKIIWVRTGKRWPRGVYNLLKGISDKDDEERKQKK